MALTDKITAIADAIRAKNGSSDLMKLDEMPAAIEAIQTGGGDDVFAGYLSDTLTELRVPDGVSATPEYFCNALQTLAKVDLNDVITLNTNNFFGCSNLVECDTSKVQKFNGSNLFSGAGVKVLDLASATNIGNTTNNYTRTFQGANFEEIKNFKPTKLHNYIFNTCAKLKTIDLSELLEVGMSSFYGCKALGDIVLPKIQKIGNGAFKLSSSSDAPTRTKIDIGADCTSIEADAFYYNGNVKTIIVRATTPPKLGASSAFNFVLSNSDAHIYVPADSYNDYQNATNWTLFVGNGTTYRKIEDYPEITGG